MIDFNKLTEEEFDNLNEKYLKELVKNDGYNVVYIKNPPENTQFVIVEKLGPYIKYIKNPCEKAQLAVVRKSGYLISYLANPSEKVQIEAINNIKYNDSDYKVCYHNKFVIKHITNKKALELYEKLKKAHSIIK
jgi:hypothetical protein